jgi:hypothetical protein
MSPERLRSVTTRSGQINVEVDGVPYHNPYNPQREALMFYRSHPVENADVVLHFGWGLGYGAQILQERLKKSARVIVFEPDEELFKFSLGQIDNHTVFLDTRFQFVVGSRVRQFFDNWTLGCQETDQFLWLTWPAAYQAHAVLADSLRESFQKGLRDRAANLLTHFQNGSLYFQQVLANLEYQGDADAGALFGRFKNVPLVIVSAGPSLDRNVRELQGMEDRCFILAVDTALRPLLASGITPHAVIIADPTELNARHIAGVMPESAYLIAEQGVHTSALRSASRRFLFGLGLFPDSLFAKYGFGKSTLQVWGSVATAALDIACKMRANPIIFTGQDFAYSWDRDYASHTIFHGAPFDARRAGRCRATDIWGREVHTTENLIAYRDFFVRRIRQTPGIRFINATEGGILTEAAEILSLRDALNQACPVEIDIRFPAGGWAPQAALEMRVSAISHLAEVLSSGTRNCKCFDEFLDLTAKEALLRRDDDAVNRSILSGWRVCEEFCQTHAEGRVAPAHRGDARAGVDV